MCSRTSSRSWCSAGCRGPRRYPARLEPNRRIFANRMSICVLRLSAYSRWSLSRISMFVLPVARPPGGSRPMMLWITVFGTCQVAIRSSAGCERTVPLTSTSTLGTRVRRQSPDGRLERIGVAAVTDVLDRAQVRQCRGRVHCSRHDRRVERLCDRAGVL